MKHNNNSDIATAVDFMGDAELEALRLAALRSMKPKINLSVPPPTYSNRHVNRSNLVSINFTNEETTSVVVAKEPTRDKFSRFDYSDSGTDDEINSNCSLDFNTTRLQMKQHVSSVVRPRVSPPHQAPSPPPPLVPLQRCRQRERLNKTDYSGRHLVADDDGISLSVEDTLDMFEDGMHSGDELSAASYKLTNKNEHVIEEDITIQLAATSSNDLRHELKMRKLLRQQRDERLMLQGSSASAAAATVDYAALTVEDDVSSKRIVRKRKIEKNEKEERRIIILNDKKKGKKKKKEKTKIGEAQNPEIDAEFASKKKRLKKVKKEKKSEKKRRHKKRKKLEDKDLYDKEDEELFKFFEKAFQDTTEGADNDELTSSKIGSSTASKLHNSTKKSKKKSSPEPTKTTKLASSKKVNKIKLPHRVSK